ncbi:MAG: multiphosphoryl transfer protein [Baekduia sp.]|nr:multiphosphoryl transfer protein [Baekduia sp.]
MVGIVIVSHSATLARAVVELAGEMGGGEVPIEAAGGMAEPEGAIGTDLELVRAAIDRAAGPDGVLVLMDLGSAVMTAEMAAEVVGGERDVRIVLSDAPLVEGAVAAVARAGAGAGLDEVAQEARSALGMKRGQLGIEEGEGPAPAPAPGPEGEQARLPVRIALGLHARPAARVVEVAGRFDARITLTDETNGRGPADARSLTGLVTLGVRHGDALVARADGPQAADALAALVALAEEGFGDVEVAEAPRVAAEPVPAAASRRAPDRAAPPAAGDVLQGVPAGAGIAIGPARPLRAQDPSSPAAADEPTGDPTAEQERLDAALASAREDVVAARARIAERAGESEAAIFDAHLLLLEDRVLLDPAQASVAGGQGATAAWAAAVAAAAESYRALDDAYLRERAADVEDVGARVLRALTGSAGAAEPAHARGILVAADLAPSDAAALDPDRVDGLAIAHGGATSHAAILARALGIPSVVGLGDAVLAIADGTPLVLDGEAGTVEVDPAASQLADRERARAAIDERRRRAREHAREPARTRDGATIEVGANVGAVGETVAAVELGADGVGLLRTEFLFLDRDTAPSESEQREVYGQIAAALGGRPLIIRTLDAGADKPLRFAPVAPEENPFLGVRGIRFGLERPELLETQLRAILAIAADADVRVMFPMVATLAEYRAARGVLEAARAELGARPIPVGIMVEVPAVAVAAERFAREVDFFSIGTNDLTQYAMAADRGNAQLAGLLSGPLPPVLGLVAQVVDGAKAHDRWVGVCGELAGDPAGAVLLAGLGVDELSVSAGLVPDVKETLRAVALSDAREVAQRALALDDVAAVRAAVAPLIGGSPAQEGVAGIGDG